MAYSVPLQRPIFHLNLITQIIAEVIINHPLFRRLPNNLAPTALKGWDGDVVLPKAPALSKSEVTSAPRIGPRVR